LAPNTLGRALSGKRSRLVRDRNRFAQERNVDRWRCSLRDAPHLRGADRGPRFKSGAAFRAKTWENEMTWKAPKIVEVPVGMEINMYACAARK
jgi:coenzyme PQQ precursor peptide PqqA